MACTICGVEATEHCGQWIAGGEESSSEDDNNRWYSVPMDIFTGDSWFASVKTADQVAKQGHAFFGPVKTATKLFPLKGIENIMKDWPGGTYIVFEGRTLAGNELAAIGYKYNSRKCLAFIMTKTAGSTVPGVPYHAHFADVHNNLTSRAVARPEIVSEYFWQSNVIDKHNHVWQGELQLEKFWVVQDCWFRIIMTFIGITVTDAWKAFKFSIGSDHPDKKSEISVVDFANRIAYNCCNNPYSSEASSPAKNLSLLTSKRPQRTSPRRAARSLALGTSAPPSGVNLQGGLSGVSPITDPTYTM
jgi:hypothetical protein